MKAGRGTLIDCAVALIDELGGAQGVNMRTVAARARCAHTNVYNYFESYEALLWAALGETLDRFVRFVEARIAVSGAQGVEAYKILLCSQIDFAREHTGLYRFLSFEHRFASPMPPEIAQRLERMEESILGLLGAAGTSEARRKELENVHRIVFRYVYGSLCSMVQGRLGEGMDKEQETTIRSNVAYLCSLLLDGNRAVTSR